MEHHLGVHGHRKSITSRIDMNYKFDNYYDRWMKHGKKITPRIEITQKILDLVNGHNEICDLIWAINAANQSDQSSDNLSNTVMDQIKKKLSPLLFNHKGKFGGVDNAKAVARANRHFRDDPKMGLQPFKDRQTKVIEVLESYINHKLNETTRSVEDAFAQGEIPTKDEIEAIYREIAKSGEKISEKILKEAIERKFARQDRKLRGVWWEITRGNLIEWSKKG